MSIACPVALSTVLEALRGGNKEEIVKKVASFFVELPLQTAVGIRLTFFFFFFWALRLAELWSKAFGRKKKNAGHETVTRVPIAPSPLKVVSVMLGDVTSVGV